MENLVLLRHGQSVWNQENRFTGWTDVDLSEQGKNEAATAAKLLKENNFTFDQAYTSVLKRAIRTLWITLDEMDLMWIPVQRAWELNERHYGALQGLNKAETAEKYGEEQVHIWRRSYDVCPPKLDKDDARYPGKDPRYKNVAADKLPCTECLKDTLNRLLPFWHSTIYPTLKAGKKVIIVAHGNSLRALVQYLDHMSEEAILKLNIPTGVPLVYDLNEKVEAVGHRYLGDPEAIAAAQNAVANQGKKHE